MEKVIAGLLAKRDAWEKQARWLEELPGEDDRRDDAINALRVKVANVEAEIAALQSELD